MIARSERGTDRRAWSGHELVEDALTALKPRYQQTRTPFDLQRIREEVEDQHGAPLADEAGDADES